MNRYYHLIAFILFKEYYQLIFIIECTVHQKMAGLLFQINKLVINSNKA